MSQSDSDNLHPPDLAGGDLASAERRRVVRDLLARSAGETMERPTRARAMESTLLSGAPSLDWSRLADSDEAGHPFRREGGHPFRGEGGHLAGTRGEQGSWWIEVAALRPSNGL